MSSSLSRLKQLGDRLSLKSMGFRRGQAQDDGSGAAAAWGGDRAAAGGRRQARAAAGAAADYTLVAQPSEEEAAAALDALAPGYFDPPQEFDALEHELRQLPVNFEATHLEAVAEERTGVLEVVSEKLSHHVIQNYDKFVAGVDEVMGVEADLAAAHVTTKRARERLALALREVGSNLKIAKDTRRKQGLTALLEALLKLQQANNLQRALKEAQEEGEYAEAFWLCAQCIKSMEELGEGLGVGQQLTVTINRLYAETTQRLETALAAVCADFRPSHYTKVLEGHMFLGNVSQLGGKVKSAFIATINSSAAKVVRGVLLTRPGYEERASVASNLQELVRFLPSDLFRTCLARVLMVLFDILVSHFHMVMWHEAALERHAADLESLAATRRQLAERLDSGGGDSGSKAEHQAAAGGAAGGATEGAGGEGAADLLGLGSAASGSSSLTAAAAAAATVPPHHPHHQHQHQHQHQSSAGSCGSRDLDGPLGSSDSMAVTGRAVMRLQRGTASELEEVEARASDEAEWGTVLSAVHAGLLGGRALIWDEVARRIAVLLSSPAAFEGEHFLQVMEWTQRVLAVGEAFSGSECASLRTLLERQSGKFFRLYHHSNIEALSSMLDKELWKRLPAALPSLSDVLNASSSSSDEAGGSSGVGSSGTGGGGGSGGGSNGGQGGGGGGSLPEFERFVVQGNPWRKQQSPRRGRRGAGAGQQQQQQLGFGGSAGTDDSTAARQLEVDEYGVPRTASNTPSSAAGGGGGGGGRSRSAQSEAGATEDGGTEDGELLERDEEPDDVFGNFIDEDTQQVRSGGEPGGTGGDVAPAVTNSSWRMYKWMRDYSQLMRPLRSAAPSIFAGLCELFELYMLHVFIAFSDISITELQQQGSGAAAAAGGALLGGSGFGGSSGSGGGGGSSLDALTPRLRATLLRIAGDSIGKYRQLFGAQAGSKLARALGGGAGIGASAVGGAPAGGAAAAGMAAGMAAAAAASSSTSQYFRRTLPSSAGSSPAPPAGVGIASQPAYPAANSGGGGGAAGLGAGPGSVTQPAGPQISAVSNSGNLFGLLERTAAVESLLAVAAQLQRARGALAHALPPGEAPALDAFYSRTVGAAEDLQDYVVRTGARLLLPLRWVPDRVAAAPYVLEEPPTGHGPWVEELGRHLELFRDRLAQAPSLEEAAVRRLWSAAAAAVAEACLEGISRVKRCSLEGRAAMSVDLQGVGRALQRLLPPGLPLNLRLVDNYIKAFYIPLTELPHWAQTHPEYSPQQMLALTACIAESSGLKRKDKAVLLAQIEGNLRAMSGGGPMGA